MAGAPSWAAVEALARKQLAKWAAGRVAENVNEYTEWYYGNKTAAPFCFIGVSWTLAHAAATEAAGLALIGGKHAYVPDIRGISGYHAGHSGMKVGAIVAVENFGHIGFVTAVTSSSFELLSFNSTESGSDDAVTEKPYSIGSANGYVNLAYGSSAAPAPTGTGAVDDMGDYLLVTKDSGSPKQAITHDGWTVVNFNKNGSAAAAKQHSAGDHPSFLQESHYYNGLISFQITGLPAGVEGQAQVYTVHPDGSPHTHCDPVPFTGSTSGDTFVTVPASGDVPKGYLARVKVTHFGGDGVTAYVVAGEVRLFIKTD